MKGQPIKVTVTSSMDRQITEAIKLYDQHTKRHLDRVANRLRNEIQHGMRDTQKQPVASKFVNGKPHYPSMAGNPPAIDTSRLNDSIQLQPAISLNGNYSASVFTNVWYARKLEEGVGVGKRPFMGEESQAFKNTQDYANRIASDISINRTLPKPARTGKKV